MRLEPNSRQPSKEQKLRWDGLRFTVQWLTYKIVDLPIAKDFMPERMADVLGEYNDLLRGLIDNARQEANDIIYYLAHCDGCGEKDKECKCINRPQEEPVK